MGFAENIKAIRKAQHMTQGQMAQLLNVSKITVGSYERGLRTPPLCKLEEYARKLKVTGDELISQKHYSKGIEREMYEEA